ncbi:MAG: hypothetical protein AAFN77_20575 [Planctomycetota bacterium]
MIINTRLAMALFVIVCVSLIGCSGQFATSSVSGKVTSGGKPVVNVRLVFSPISYDVDTDPGPWSTGITNAKGEYTLETRNGRNGASIGRSNVSFYFDDPDDMETLREDLAEAKGEYGSPEEVTAVKKRIADYKALMKTRPKISEDYSVVVEVKAGGMENVDFDLPK